jgi:SAM-dependent methyltransferase
MWNERYAESGFAYGTEVNDFLAEQAFRLPEAGDVLCLAEGEGRNAVYLAQRGLSVTGVDASSVGLDKARRLAAERGVTIHTVVADLGDYDLGAECWDAVVSIWCHVPHPLRRRIHHAVTRALKPGGVFILEAYTPAQIGYETGGPKAADRLMTLAAVQLELEGLQFLIGRETERDVHEGKYHEGKSAVLQVVAVKPS